MLKKSSYRTLLRTFVSLSTVALGATALSGCSSDEKPTVCMSADNQWRFDCSDTSQYEYVGAPGVPCTTPDGLRSYDVCGDETTVQYHGFCVTTDPNWVFDKCSDPSTARWVGAGPAPSAAPSLTGQQPPPMPPPGTSGVAPVTSVAPVVPSGQVTPDTTTPVSPITVNPDTTTPATPDPLAPVSPDTTTTPGTDVPTTDASPVDPGPVDPGPAAPVDAANRTCPAYEGLIADFEEEGEAALRLVEAEGRIGLIDVNNDGSAEQLLEVIAEGTEACNNKVLHTSGSGFDTWGAGVETVLSGTWDEAEAGYTPNLYDAAALGYDGISFRAKKGASHANPVKFSLSVPGTRAPTAQGDGSCQEDGPEGDPKACWNHPGHYLIDDEELTTDWKTFTFCINGDLYPTWLPFVLSPEQRVNVGSELMTLGFEFNKTDDAALGDAFDFYVDDVKLVKNACNAAAGVFQSSEGSTDPFGTNDNIGTCEPIPNASDYNRAISEAYARWKGMFLANDGGVIDPQSGNRVVSEAIGYGMLITAAMGDKPAFDSIFGWAKSRMNWSSNTSAPGNLLGWLNGGGGSAADADTDMAYALLMAGKQWGGDYAAAGQSLASFAKGKIAPNGYVTGGELFTQTINPSYFSPGFYSAFTGWQDVTSGTLGKLETCSSSFGGLLPDWCSTGGQAIPASETGADQVAPELCGTGPCLAMDGARVPWRLGFGVCIDGTGRGLLESFLGALKSKDPDVMQGERMDLLKTGWSADGPFVGNAVPNTMAFVGPVAVGAWALGQAEATTRDRAFRAALDLIQNPEYYDIYYQNTVALMSLLTITGNWPTP